MDGAIRVPGEARIVRHHADRRPLAVQILEEGHDRLAVARVEVARRLVGEQDAGLADQGAGDRHPLLLAPRELARKMARAVRHADLLQRLAHRLRPLRRLHAAVGERQLDVLVHREVADQVEALEDEADLAIADAGPLGEVEVLDRVIVEHVGALAGRIEQPEDRQQRRLAAPRRAGDGNVLAAPDLELHAGEGAAGQAVKSGQPVIVNDYQSWPGRSAIFQGSPFDAILSVPMRWEGQVFGALNVVDRGERRPFTEEDVRLLSLFADLASIAIKNAELYAQLRQASHDLENKVEQRTLELTLAQAALARNAHQLQRLLAITHRIQEEERTRIARDLHDGSNQLITGTLFEIQAAQQCIRGGHPEDALEKLETAKGLQRKIDAENRRIISGLRPPILDSQGLAPALKWHANAFQERYQITCSVQVSGQPQRLSPAAETAVYRIVQESLNNVAAHAQARKIQIGVDFGPARLRVVVEDDGVGFDYEQALANAPGQMGLIGMNERARSIEGQMEIRSSLGQGTRLMLEVPVGQARKLEASALVNSEAAASKK